MLTEKVEPRETVRAAGTVDVVVGDVAWVVGAARVVAVVDGGRVEVARSDVVEGAAVVGGTVDDVAGGAIVDVAPAAIGVLDPPPQAGTTKTTMTPRTTERYDTWPDGTACPAILVLRERTGAS